jgi:cytochrome P450
LHEAWIAGLIPPGEEGRARLAALVAQWLATAKEGGLLAELRKIGGKVDIPGHYVENSVGMIFNASYGTLFATLGNVALTLAQHPEAVEELRSHGDRKFLETAVDELIRYDGPAQGTSRLATREVTIGGTRVQPGEVVLTLLASANRDPDEFDRPEELVLDRAPNRHLAFGWGVHGCIGALFGRAVVQELIICLRDSSQLVLTGKPVRRTTATVRSMDLLPVKFA